MMNMKLLTGNWRLAIGCLLLLLTGNVGAAILPGYPVNPLRGVQPALSRVVSDMQTTQSVMVLEMGDSVMSFDGLGDTLFEHFVQYYGFCGGTGGPEHTDLPAGHRFGYDSGGGTVRTLDVTHWYCDHFVLPAAAAYYQIGMYQPGSSYAGLGVTSRVMEVVYASSNGYGGFSISTNDGNGGAYTVITNIVANAPLSQPYETNVVWRLTNAAVISPTLRVTCLSNQVRVLAAGLWDDTHPGLILNQQARPSMTLANFISVPTNLWGPVFRTWNPSLILYKQINGGSVSHSNNLAAFIGSLKYWCPNTAIVFVGDHPIETGDADLIAYNLATKLAAQANGIPYYPGHELFWDSWANGRNRGYLKEGSDVHLTYSGAEFMAGALWDWMNLLGTRGLYMGVPYQGLERELRLDWGFVATGSKSNAFEATQLGRIMGGIQANGVNFLQLSNTAVPRLYPSGYRIYSQKAGLVVTNISTATNSLLGTTTDGLCAAGAQLWETNRTFTFRGKGTYFTGATPGICMIGLNMDLTGTTTSNTLCLTRFTPPANQNPGTFRFEIDCVVTNAGSSGGILAEGTLVTLNGNTPTEHTLTNQLSVLNLGINVGTFSVIVTNGAVTDSWNMGPLIVEMK